MTYLTLITCAELVLSLADPGMAMYSVILENVRNYLIP